MASRYWLCRQRDEGGDPARDGGDPKGSRQAGWGSKQRLRLPRRFSAVKAKGVLYPGP